MTASPHDPLGIIGTTVAEKYRILAVAGEGGFSTVYQAEHLIWKQPVAIKFFNILEDADANMREQLLNDFIQEGKLMSELSSKSAAIVQARDIGKLAVDDGNWIPYMVLEWLDGTPLDIVLNREAAAGMPGRSIEQIMVLLEPCAVALDVAHKQNVAHRDMKPANIMVMGDPRSPDVAVKVLDFGIAKVMADREQLQQQLELTGHQITAFTPNHGAPEQFSRNYGATGPWTDVYAMALIIVEIMRGGARALAGDTFFELGVSSCDPNKRPTPSALGIPIAQEIDAVFARALAVAPSDRYPTMGAFWADLYRIVFPGSPTWRSTRREITGEHTELLAAGMPASRAVPHTAPGVVSAAPKESGKSMVVIGGAIGVVAIAGAVGAVALIGGGDETTPSPEASTTSPTPSASVSSKTPAQLVEWDGPCPKGMKPVTGGKFQMGSDDDSFPLWKPAHDVTIDTFCLATNEVTVGDYKQCVDAGKCQAASEKSVYPKPKGIEEEDHQKLLTAFSELCNWGKSGRDDHPINCVDWQSADAYCAWKLTRLPTEAEWELAARGEDGRKFPWGDDAGDHTYMNAAGIEWRKWHTEKGLSEPGSLMYEQDDKFVGTAPVGKFPRAQTQAGQMDMVGNVWEWTYDRYALYKAEAQTNPKGPSAGDKRAIRGGGFNGENAIWVNPAARYFQVETATVHAIGFRCASDVKPE